MGEAATKSIWTIAFAVSDGMGGAQAGEFASRMAVEKITDPAAALLSTIRPRTGSWFFRCAGGNFRSNPPGPGICWRQRWRMRRHGSHPEPLLVHSRADVFRPHRRQPDLLFARARRRHQATQPRRHPRRLAIAQRAKSTSARPAPIPAATSCKKPWAAATSLSIPKLAPWLMNRATSFCFARMVWCRALRMSACWSFYALATGRRQLQSRLSPRPGIRGERRARQHDRAGHSSHLINRKFEER